jgi:hypothetical protein
MRAWPGPRGQQVLAAVRESDAFGALAWRLDQATRECLDPVEVLCEIDDDSVEWALEAADDPAAFLASRVRGILAGN